MFLFLVLAALVQAQYEYTTNNGTITITKYTGSGGAISIPDTINDLPVTSIGYEAFGYCTNLTSVTIPNSVTSIGTMAFHGCTLTSITIPNSVTNIGSIAFGGCKNLISVTIPSSVISIKEAAFSQCPSLTNVMILDGVISIGRLAFSGCTNLANITIPNSVTGIGSRAFTGCSSLVSISIPDGVTEIPHGTDLFGMFSRCTSLTNVTIGNSVTNIGQYAFLGCTSLSRITIPDDVHSIWYGVFRDCTNLSSVYFQGNVPSGSSFPFSDVGGSRPTVYYLPGTTGWGRTFGGRPTALWVRPNPVILSGSVGIQTNQLGFTISWATNNSVVVEASTTLTNPTWSPVATNTLSGGTAYFSDSQWTNYPTRFYRVRSP